MMKKTGKRWAVAIFALLIALSMATVGAAYAQESAKSAADYVTHGSTVTVEAAQGGGYHVTGSVASNSKFAYNQRVNTKVGFGVDLTYKFDLSAGDNVTRWFGIFVNRAVRDNDGNVTDGALLPAETADIKNGVQIMFGADPSWSTWDIGLNVKLRAAGKVTNDTLLHTLGSDTTGGPAGSEAEGHSGAWVAWALRKGKTVHYDFTPVAAESLYRITLSYTHEDNTKYSVPFDIPFDRVGGALDGDAILGVMQLNSVSSPAALDYTVGEVKNKSDIFGISIAESQALVGIGNTQKVQANVDLLKADTTENTAITWSSDDESIATVANGVISGVAAGTTTVRASLANGMSAAVSVIVGDAPAISVSGVPASAVQYAEVVLPAPDVDAGVLGDEAEFEAVATVSGAESLTLKEPFAFKPNVPGEYKVKYSAKFENGLTVTTQEFTIEVTRAQMPILQSWQTSGSANSEHDVYATSNGKGIVATGSVGGGYASTENKRDTAKYVFDEPIDLNAATVFDLTLNLDLDNFADEDKGNGDQFRSFAIVLNQSAKDASGTVDATKLDKVLNLDDGLRGVQIAFGKAGTWGEWPEGLRWETSDTAGAVGKNHFHTTSASGKNSIPDLPDGDDKFLLARKISGGETFRVKIQKVGDELHFKVHNILWRFPMSEIAFTDENNIYLAFVSDNMSGTSKVDFRVENLMNGFVESVTFEGEESERTLEIGATHVLTPHIEWKEGVDPTDLTVDGSVRWSTSNPSVATVENGTVTALKPGRAVIRATSADGKYAELTVIVPAKSVTIDIAQKTIKVGKGFRLTATADPADTVVSFESENTVVATVNERGDVVGVSAGTTKIYAYAGDKRAECTVTVEDYVLESLAFAQESYTFAAGERVQLQVEASDASIPLAWSVSDETVAEITSTGYIYGKKAGTVTVTVTGGGKTATCIVTFTQADEGGKESGGCFGAVQSATFALGALLICGAVSVVAIKAKKAKGEQ